MARAQLNSERQMHRIMLGLRDPGARARLRAGGVLAFGLIASLASGSLQVAAAPSPSAALLGAASSCSRSAVDLATTPTSLRSLADLCRDLPDLAILAVAKLNALPSPKPATALVMRRTVPPAVTPVATMSADIAIFFGVGESYPTEEGIAALRRFVEELNAGRAVVKSVFVLGTVDAAEADTQLGRPLAKGRAAILHDYLVAAGVDKSLITVAIRTAPADGAGRSAAVPADRMARAVVVLAKSEQP